MLDKSVDNSPHLDIEVDGVVTPVATPKDEVFVPKPICAIVFLAIPDFPGVFAPFVPLVVKHPCIKECPPNREGEWSCRRRYLVKKTSMES